MSRTGKLSIDGDLVQNIGDMIVIWEGDQNLENVGWFDGILWAQEEVVIVVMLF